MSPKHTIIKSLSVVIAAIGFTVASQAQALDAAKLDAEVNATMATFLKEQPDASDIMGKARGTLVCPKITKGGFGFGAAHGKCELFVSGQTKDYYGYSAVKWGFLAGISSYSLIMVFNDEAALGKFRSDNREWEVGADVNVAVAKKGAGGVLDTNNVKEPVVAFIFGEKGLMADASLKGGRFKKLDK